MKTIIGDTFQRSDVGKAKIGMRVSVQGRNGVVKGFFEPSWISHKTKQFMIELQSIDILFDDQEENSMGFKPITCINVSYEHVSVLIHWKPQ